MKTTGGHVVIALLLTFYGGSVLACGHCVEDRIAAVYDHALLQQTAAHQQQIAYFALEGRLSRDNALHYKIRALVEATPGVTPGSARVSLEPGALAIAFDPQRASTAAMASLLQKKLRAINLTLLLLHVPRT